MPEVIEPADGEAASEEIAALQDVQAEQEDVQAHGIGLSGDPNSTMSVGSYCDITT